jgi:glycosyltransferase involved in cell wall biosynthesis
VGCVDISVIIPVYNTGKYLIKCLDSLENQSFPKERYELIIINDGSTDDSASIAKEYKNKYSNIRYIEKENGGQASARNMGMSVASGNYFCFVDSDDYCFGSYLEKLYDACKNSGADISVCRKYKDNNGIISDYNFGQVFSGIYEDIDYIVSGASFAPWAMLIDRRLWHNTGFTEGMTYEDMAVIPVIMHRAAKIIYIDDRMYYYRIHNSSTLMKNVVNRKMNWDIIKAFDILFASELKNYPDVLTSIYIRYILASACRQMYLCHDQSRYTVTELVKRGKDLFPDIKKKVIVGSMSLDEVRFVQLLLKEHFLIAQKYVSIVNGIKNINGWLTRR